MHEGGIDCMSGIHNFVEQMKNKMNDYYYYFCFF